MVNNGTDKPEGIIYKIDRSKITKFFQQHLIFSANSPKFRLAKRVMFLVNYFQTFHYAYGATLLPLEDSEGVAFFNKLDKMFTAIYAIDMAAYFLRKEVWTKSEGRWVKKLFTWTLLFKIILIFPFPKIFADRGRFEIGCRFHGLKLARLVSVHQMIGKRLNWRPYWGKDNVVRMIGVRRHFDTAYRVISCFLYLLPISLILGFIWLKIAILACEGSDEGTDCFVNEYGLSEVTAVRDFRFMRQLMSFTSYYLTGVRNGNMVP